MPLSSPVLRIGALPPRCRCDAVVVERVRPWSCSGSPPPTTSGGVRCCGPGACLIPPDLSRRRRVVLQQPHASGMTSHAAGCRLCAAPAGGQRCPYSSTPLAVDGGSAISRAGPKRVPLAAGQGRVTRRQCDRAADFSRSHPRIGPLEPQSGCSRVTSMVFCDGKDGCSAIIEHFCRTTRILVTLYSQGLELWRLTKSVQKSDALAGKGTQGPSWCNEMTPKYE